MLCVIVDEQGRQKSVTETLHHVQLMDRIGPTRLKALGQHLMLGQRRVDVVRACARLPAVLAELDLQLLHLVVVEVLLHQVALPLHPSPDVGRNVGDHPGHEELHHEDNVLPGEGTQIAVFSEWILD